MGSYVNLAREAIARSRASEVRVYPDTDSRVLALDKRNHTSAVEQTLQSREPSRSVPLPQGESGPWDETDWHAFYEERASIIEYKGGIERPKAKAWAFEAAVVQWMNSNPEPSEPGRCAWCGEQERSGSVVVPFGTDSHGHTWLHPECWSVWYRSQRERAEKALAQYGLQASVTDGSGAGGTNRSR